MNHYQPIIYIWIEVPVLPGTIAQFTLAQYLGGDIRTGKPGSDPVIRCHTWLSDTDIIPYREVLPADLSSAPLVLHDYAEAVRGRIVEFVGKEMKKRKRDT